MSKERRHFSPEEKVKIIRLRFLEKKPISEICQAQGIHPTLFYQWQKAFIENGAAAFAKQPDWTTNRKPFLRCEIEN